MDFEFDNTGYLVGVRVTDPSNDCYEYQHFGYTGSATPTTAYNIVINLNGTDTITINGRLDSGLGCLPPL